MEKEYYRNKGVPFWQPLKMMLLVPENISVFVTHKQSVQKPEKTTCS